MPQGAKDEADGAYMLGTGGAGAARLRLVDEVHGASTRRILLESGLRAGMRVLDLGCGIGAVSRWMAGIAGASGSVAAVDIDLDQLALAKASGSEREGDPPIDYLEASAYATGLPSQDFDLVHCRVLLCHLTRPADALTEMRRLLKPGGVLVCQDLNISAIFAWPPSEAYARSVEIMRRAAEARGVNYDFGLDLPKEVLRAGFRSPVASLDQPAYLRGPGKRLWERTVEEASPGILRNGCATREELALLLRQMGDAAALEDVLIAQARMPGVWAVK